MEFCIEPSSFEFFNCTKEVLFGIKYAPLFLSQMQKSNNDDRVIFKVLDDDDCSCSELFRVELETATGITKKFTVELKNNDQAAFVPIMVKYYFFIYASRSAIIKITM